MALLNKYNYCIPVLIIIFIFNNISVGVYFFRYFDNRNLIKVYNIQVQVLDIGMTMIIKIKRLN